MQDFDINKDGLLLHGTDFEKLDSILKYGLVSGCHFQKNRTQLEGHSYYNRQKYGCPCCQDIPITYSDLRGILFFSVMGNKYNCYPNKYSFKKGDETPFRFPGSDFGIIIDPKNYFNRLPSKSVIESLEFQMKLLLKQDVTAEKEDTLFRYYEYLQNMINIHIKGESPEGYDFMMTSCTPWEKFSVLIVSGSYIPGPYYESDKVTEEIMLSSEKLKMERLDILVSKMEEVRPLGERLPIYDTENNLLYSPNFKKRNSGVSISNSLNTRICV